MDLQQCPINNLIQCHFDQLIIGVNSLRLHYNVPCTISAIICIASILTSIY